MPDNAKLVAIIIFVLTYLFIIIFYHKKFLVVIISVLILLLSKSISARQALDSIDWNVMLIYFGMLFVGEVFLFSKMPDYLAALFASKTKSVAVAMLVICAFTGFVSLFLENVAVVLLLAPIALSIAKKCEINPVPLFIGMAISSNLQGAGTLIGDPPSMLLAGFAHLNFNDFFILNGKPSIFFAVQAGALISLSVLYIFFKKYDKKTPQLPREKYVSIVPTFLVILMVIFLILSSFVNHTFSFMLGLICSIFGILCFIWYLWRTRADNISNFLSTLDWHTGFFLIGIFILVKSLAVSGVMEDMAGFIVKVSGASALRAFMVIVVLSVLLSAFVDNIPFLLVMLPVTKMITEQMHANPYLFYFGLLIGVSVGGNITPLGASANIVAMGIMKKNGYHITFMEFVKMGLPFTVTAVIGSSLFIWFVFS